MLSERWRERRAVTESSHDQDVSTSCTSDSERGASHTGTCRKDSIGGEETCVTSLVKQPEGVVTTQRGGSLTSRNRLVGLDHQLKWGCCLLNGEIG